MVTLSYSSPVPTSNDPIFVRTHFLGRVASEGLGLEYHHEIQKRSSSSRNSDLHRWDATWLAPVTHELSYDSEETSDTDDEPAATKSTPAQHVRSRSSTLPFTFVSTPPVEMTRSRSMTAPTPSSSSSFETETRSLRRKRSTDGSESRLMPARPLSINTAQPLRLSVSDVPSPIATVGPSPKTSSPPVVRIECSESDGSCHGDAGDQDPEAQLAAGIIRLREQRRSSTKAQRRAGAKRRALAQSSPSSSKKQLPVSDDVDSDDGLAIRKHGGNFVLRLAEMVLDFGSSALEKLVVSESDDSEGTDDLAFEPQQSPLQSRRRSSTTPAELTAEAGELLRRRRERLGSVSAESDQTGKASLTRSWSVPKLLSLPFVNPSASLRALSASTASTPATPLSAPGFGFTKISDEPSRYQAVNALDDVGSALRRGSASYFSHPSSVDEVLAETAGHVSPLWKQ